MRKILIFFLIMFSFLGKSQTKNGGIFFPKDEFAVVNSSYDGKPAVIVVNTGLRKLGFRLSVWLGQLMKEKNRSIARAVLVIENKVIYRPFFG